MVVYEEVLENLNFSIFETKATRFSGAGVSENIIFREINRLCAYAGLNNVGIVELEEAVANMNTLEGKVAARIIIGRDAKHPAFEMAAPIIQAAYELAGCSNKFYSDFALKQ